MHGSIHTSLRSPNRVESVLYRIGRSIRDVANSILHELEKESRSFNKKIKPSYRQLLKIMSVSPSDLRNLKSSLSNSLLRAGDLKSRMLEVFQSGRNKGTTTYFQDLDNHWTWKKKELTCITGHPGHGKSEFDLQLCLIKAIKDNEKFAIYSPENMPEEEVFNQLIHAYTGESTDLHHRNQMSQQKYLEAIDVIHEHFFLVDLKDVPQTLSNVLSVVDLAKVKYDIVGFTLDPWNALEHDETIRDDKQVRAGLTQVRNFINTRDLYGRIIAHPRSVTPKEDGSRPVPTQWYIAQGAMWDNRCDNIISVHRPNYHIDPSDTHVDIHCLKIKKQKLVGIPGTVNWDYGRLEARYYENGMSPLSKLRRIDESGGIGF